MGYGLGYFTLIFRQWILSIHLDNIMGPGINKKLPEIKTGDELVD